MKHPDLVWEVRRADGRVVSCLLVSRASTYAVVRHIDGQVSDVEEFTNLRVARAHARVLYAEVAHHPRAAGGRNSGTKCRSRKSEPLHGEYFSQAGRAAERQQRTARGRRHRQTGEPALSQPAGHASVAFEAAGVGTWEMNVASGVTRWSAALERLHRLTPGGFKGTFDAFVDLVDEQDRQRVRDAMAGALRDGGDIRLEYRVTWPDGSARWIAKIGRVLDRADGQPTRAAGIGLDITSQKNLERQFLQAQKMEAVGRLAGGIAHDLNNYLTAIIGYSELLLGRMADQADVADLEEIRKAGERASRLTSQLLAFSRKQPIAPLVLDLNHVVAELETMLHRLIGENIICEVNLASSLAPARVDPTQVEQVLMNLVVNARDAMPRGGRLSISTANVILDSAFARRHADAVLGRYVSLMVTDTGCGMTPDVLAHVFEPFFTTKPIGKGTGLGLSTVYGIVKQNGGCVTVESTPGTGTTVAIYWPQVDEPLDKVSPDQGPVRRLEGTETVLLVEDETSVLELARKTLECYGYKVLLARNAAEAIAIEERHDGPVHLLLTDIVMPGLSGPDLAQRLARRRPAMPVLYMSGFARHVTLGVGVLSRRAALLQKPFTPQALVANVRRCLERDEDLRYQEPTPR